MTKSLAENKKDLLALLGDSADIKKIPIQIGVGRDIECFITYVEITGGSLMFSKSVFGRLVKQLNEMTKEEVYESLSKNVLGITDITSFDTIEDALGGMFAGDVLILVDGFEKAMKIPDKGYPGMGVQEPQSEKVIRGSNEGFADSIKINTALIRKRLRTPKLKVREVRLGTRSNTNVDIVYMEDLVYPKLIGEV